MHNTIGERMKETLKPYKDGVTSTQIIEDGWARGFDIMQTKSELEQMGFDISIDKIKDDWSLLDTAFEYDMRQYD